jgi:hypothetical protein
MFRRHLPLPPEAILGAKAKSKDDKRVWEELNMCTFGVKLPVTVVFLRLMYVDQCCALVRVVFLVFDLLACLNVL